MLPSMLRRRADAARRLPPLPCGCSDPDSRSHLDHLPAHSALSAEPLCYGCSSVGLDALKRRAAQADPRCACARRLGVEVGAA